MKIKGLNHRTPESHTKNSILKIFLKNCSESKKYVPMTQTCENGGFVKLSTTHSDSGVGW